MVTAANWVYVWGHWPVLVASGVWLYRSRPGAYGVYRDAILISGAIGLVLFALFPAAPPRLAGLDVVDTVTQYSNAYRVLQPPALTNQFAAFPSLHFGWNLVIGIALVGQADRRSLRLFGFVMPVLMLAAIVLTANHYLLDSAGGGIVALVGLAASTQLHRRRAGRRVVSGGHVVERARLAPGHPIVAPVGLRAPGAGRTSISRPAAESGGEAVGLFAGNIPSRDGTAVRHRSPLALRATRRYSIPSRSSVVRTRSS